MKEEKVQKPKESLHPKEPNLKFQLRNRFAWPLQRETLQPLNPRHALKPQPQKNLELNSLEENLANLKVLKNLRANLDHALNHVHLWEKRKKLS